MSKVPRIRLAGVCAVALLIALSFVHPFGNPREPNASSGHLFAGAQIPEPLPHLRSTSSRNGSGICAPANKWPEEALTSLGLPKGCTNDSAISKATAHTPANRILGTLDIRSCYLESSVRSVRAVGLRPRNDLLAYLAAQRQSGFDIELRVNECIECRNAGIAGHVIEGLGVTGK